MAVHGQRYSGLGVNHDVEGGRFGQPAEAGGHRDLSGSKAVVPLDVDLVRSLSSHHTAHFGGVNGPLDIFPIEGDVGGELIPAIWFSQADSSIKPVGMAGASLLKTKKEEALQFGGASAVANTVSMWLGLRELQVAVTLGPVLLVREPVPPVFQK